MTTARLLITLLLSVAVPAQAATIFTFEVNGTDDFDTAPLSFSPGLPSQFTFVKPLDASSPDFFQAVAAGTSFAAATFIAYDTSIDPLNELFRYSFAGNVLFTSLTPAGLNETVTLTADSMSRADGPASVPEPGSLLLLATGLLAALAQGRRCGR
jgi:hypothetical protein